MRFLFSIALVIVLLVFLFVGFVRVWCVTFFRVSRFLAVVYLLFLGNFVIRLMAYVIYGLRW